MKFDLNLLDDYVKSTTMCCEKHPSGELYLYGYYSDHYTKTPTIWDEVSIHCRGLILDLQGEIVERPFPKFWTYRQYLSENTLLLSENKVIKVPKGEFKIFDKIDGTMVTLYWIDDTPFLATQRSFTNIKAVEATKLLHEKYTDLFSKLNRNYTYVFEAVYPETKVLIDYGDTRELFLIGVIDKESGVNLPLPDIGFPKSEDYTEKYGHIKNFDDLKALDLPNREGFVIYFNNGLMIKLKFPWYQKAHKVLDFFIHKDKMAYAKYKELTHLFEKPLPIISKKDIWNALRKGDDNLLSIKQAVPDFYYLMGFDYWLSQSRAEIKEKIEIYGQIHTLTSDIWDSIAPQVEDEFDLERRIHEPHIFETSVWKWEARYLKQDLL